LDTFFSLEMLSNIIYGTEGRSISAKSLNNPFISIRLGNGS